MSKSAEHWLDTLNQLWAFNRGDGVLVRSFFTKDLPAAVTADMAPCAVSYITDCQPMYSAGGPTILHWEGQTDFHLTRDVKPANMGYLHGFYERILVAAMASITLGGKVHNFQIVGSSGAMRSVTYKKADGQDDHQGIVVRWTVEQHVSGQYSISA